MMTIDIALKEGNATLAARLPTHVLSVGSILAFDGTISWDFSPFGKYVNRLDFLGSIWNGDPSVSGSQKITADKTMKQVSVTSNSNNGSKAISFSYALSNFGTLPDAQLYFHLVVVFNYTSGLFDNGSINIPVVYDSNYVNPAISAFSVIRCNTSGVTDETTGTKAKISITYAIDTLANTNEKHLVIKSRETGTTPWTDQTVVITGYAYAYTINDLVLDRVFEIEKSYEFQAVLTDLRNSATANGVMATARLWVGWNPDKTGACFGGYCEGAGLESKMGLRNPATWRSQLGIKTGKVAFTATASGATVVSVVFDAPFTAPPNIVFSLEADADWGAASYFLFAHLRANPTAAGFSLRIINNYSSARSGFFHWQAIGI